MTKETAGITVNYVFYDEFTAKYIGIQDDSGKIQQLCCSEGVTNTYCTGKTGQVAVTTSTGWPAVHSSAIPGNGRFGAQEAVRQTGYQSVMVALCAAGPDVQATMDVQVTADLTFKNPYGYVPGAMYAMLPWHGVMFCLYALFCLGYIVVMLRNRAFLLPLQYTVLAVGGAGLLEASAYFFMYLSKNASGEASCCPASADVIFAAVVSVLKTASSAVGLLGVCMGFGVVHERLSRGITLRLGALWLLLVGFGINAEVRRLTEYEVAASGWELPVVVLQLVLIMGIYSALTTTIKDLHTARQTAKLEMYTRLYKMLYVMLAVWVLQSFVRLLAGVKAFPVSWRALWFFNEWYNLLYLGALLGVAYIWLPSQSAQQYLLYSQPVMTDDMSFSQRQAVVAVGAEAPDDAGSLISMEEGDVGDDSRLDASGVEMTHIGRGAFALGDEEDDEGGQGGLVDEDDVEIDLAALDDSGDDVELGVGR